MVYGYAIVSLAGLFAIPHGVDHGLSAVEVGSGQVRHGGTVLLVVVLAVLADVLLATVKMRCSWSSAFMKMRVNTIMWSNMSMVRRGGTVRPGHVRRSGPMRGRADQSGALPGALPRHHHPSRR